ncbi:IS110 family transposase [Arthrobacter sp. ISL-69]|uniref:IS110 family transposase n=1 Tax=Arthrobacter sp. ISL-69 TaxID=2819113 RepID=UPI002034B746|nr:IS110 family transposase [Arthrobacter sp. ISL-69]
MEVIHPRCAGVDISNRDAKVCVRIQGRGNRATTSTVMEAAGAYWRPFYYLLEDDGLEIVLVNARDARNVPGPQDRRLGRGLAGRSGAHGLVRASFVPPPPIRELRDLTRAGTIITRERTREIQRLEKLLEDACIKLSSVASEITGVSGRLLLQALIDGQTEPQALAEMARGRMRSRIPELTEALTGRFSAHHRYMTAMYLRRIDAHTADISDLSARIEEAMEPFRLTREILVSIPGFSTTTAEIFIAETGADMAVFATAGQLARWAGICPGSNESAGRVKSTKTRPGSPYLKGALGIAALSVARSNNTYFAAKYRRIASRRGPLKALVAVEHAMLTAAWHMHTTGALYQDPGADYFNLRAPTKTKARAIGQLESLGYKVTINHSQKHDKTHLNRHPFGFRKWGLAAIALALAIAAGKRWRQQLWLMPAVRQSR